MLDVHIRWLRLKIENAPYNPRYIKTVRRLGYRFAGLKEYGRSRIRMRLARPISRCARKLILRVAEH